MSTFTDEECIAIALLHGADFASLARHWYIDMPGFEYAGGGWHPIEERGAREFTTRGEIARAYCEYHRLLT